MRRTKGTETPYHTEIGTYSGPEQRALDDFPAYCQGGSLGTSCHPKFFEDAGVWVVTVRRLMNRASPISASERPSAIR